MSDFKRIPPEQAQALREQGAVVVDIRDPQSFANGHISGSRHLDNHSLAAFIAAADLDDARIFRPFRSASDRIGLSRIMKTAGGVTNRASGRVRLNSLRRCPSITFQSLRVAS